MIGPHASLQSPSSGRSHCPPANLMNKPRREWGLDRDGSGRWPVFLSPGSVNAPRRFEYPPPRELCNNPSVILPMFDESKSIALATGTGSVIVQGEKGTVIGTVDFVPACPGVSGDVRDEQNQKVGNRSVGCGQSQSVSNPDTICPESEESSARGTVLMMILSRQSARYCK